MELEKIPEKEGLIIILAEKQEGVLSHEGQERELRNSGKILVANATESPIYDLEISLKNFEKTNLEKKVFVGFVPKYDPVKGPKEVEYKLKEVARAVSVIEQLVFPEDFARPIALMQEDIPIKIRLMIKNSTDKEFALNIAKPIPDQIKIVNLPTLESGSIRTEDSRLIIEGLIVRPHEETKVEIDATVSAKSEEAFRSGVVVYRYFSEGLTVSGLDVEEVKGVLNVIHHVDKTERLEHRGVWDYYIIVDNKSKAPIKVIAEIGVVEGKALSPEEGGAEIKGSIERKIPGKRDYDTIIWEPVIVNPAETARIGPFTIAHEAEPKLVTNLKVWIIPEVIKRTAGEFRIEDIEIPVVWGRITKELKVEHPPYIKGLTEHQLVGHLAENIHATVRIDNLGSASLDRVVVTAKIPADFKPPRPVNVKVYAVKGGGEFELPPEMVQIDVSPQDPDPSKEHTLRIVMTGFKEILGEPLLRGESIIIRYTIQSVDPKPGVIYEFPAEAEIAFSPDTRPLRIVLDEVPKLETMEALRKIAKSKEVEPGETENEYVVIVTLKNEGDLPVENYEFIERIPETFDFIAEKAEPAAESVEEVVGGLEVRWIIKEIPAKSEYKIKYTVIGKPGHKVSDLFKIIE
ncbi:MAG: hypothetical protein ACTSX9_01970 [Candidatus Njordarchaeales archaeon]